MKRDEVNRLEAAVRSANPVPSVEDLVGSDEATAVTLLVGQRRRAVTATPAATAPQPTRLPPQRRRSTVWAFGAGFALVLLVVGAAALLLRGDDPRIAVPPADDPSPIAPHEAAGVQWRSSIIPEPWVASIIDVAALPQGGFVVAATDDWSVLWSPDGIDWFDADPQREVRVLPLKPGWFGSQPQVIAPIGDRVVVLDDTGFGLGIGDLETGRWDFIEFDTTDLDGETGLLAVAANETDVVVIGYEDDYGSAEPARCGEAQSVVETRHLAWRVDLGSGDVQRVILPLNQQPDGNGPAGPRGMAGARVCGDAYTSLAWFKGRWVLDLDGALLFSADGTAWTRAPAGVGPGSATLMAGPDTLLAEVWNSLWYSDTGADWTEVPEPDPSSGPNHRGPSDAVAYSDTFGYVATPWSDPGLFVSQDGRQWELATEEVPDMDAMAASGDTAFGFDPESRVAYLLSYTSSEASD